MSRVCQITGKGVLTGNKVSHSNRKSKKKFRPSVRKNSFFSEALGRRIKLKTSTHGLRVIESNYGLDQYLINARVQTLDSESRKIRKMILASQAVKSAEQLSDNAAN